MELKVQSILPEVDGDRLKLAREALGLSRKELANKLCLSHLHIAQLEANQLAIFFTPTHKVQVAKKVGAALGLEEVDYLTKKVVQKVDKTLESDSFSAPLVNPFDQKDLYVVGKGPLLNKPKLFLAPALLAGAFALGISTQIYSNELLMSDLAQIIGLKTPMSQLHTFAPEAPSAEVSAPLAGAASTNNESEIPLKSNPLENCSFEAFQLTQYQTSNPSKKGEMVYVLSKEPQSACVIDSQNKMVSVDLAAGDSKSFYGQAPFTVVSSDLSKFDLYFQGWTVRSEALSKRAIRLEEVDYLAAN
jgi:transcriptional regulator with XRE-family HTH domain